MNPLNNEILLSIIIPVYGVEQFISELMDSLFPQLTIEVECIFIDDGCIDQSIQLLQNKLSNQSYNQNIKIIHQKNQGQSVARNNGLKQATGQYIAYLDPDDYVATDYIKSILDTIQNENFDILHFNAVKINHKHYREDLRLVIQSGFVNIDDTYLTTLFKKKLWFPWLRVIKKDLLNDFSFPPNYIMEDMLAFPFLYKKVKTIYELNKPLVFYRYRTNSAMNSKISPHLINSLDYGIKMFRPFATDQHLGFLYRSFVIESFFKKSKLSHTIFSEALKNYQSDLNIIKLYLNEVHWKKRLLVKYPNLFFFYNKIKDFIKGKKY